MVSELINIAKSALRLRRKNRVIIILYNGCIQLVSQSPIKIKRGQIKARNFISQQIKVPIALVAFVINKAQSVNLLRR